MDVSSTENNVLPSNTLEVGEEITRMQMLLGKNCSFQTLKKLGQSNEKRSLHNGRVCGQGKCGSNIFI